MHWQFGEMEFGEMKGNTSNWSNFCMLLRRAGLTASAGLSCLYVNVKSPGVRNCFLVIYRIIIHMFFRYLFTRATLN